ncbi:hypothetical protein L4D04_14100 [Photobacterium angustum]|uniref:Uncharacterized protein n=1 Tax=Photobacterium angustum (strain S14 / CCUG 15956) TaxID=314292 RepID=Q1ZTF4_PHOAS|nr:hypothetical protein [Photobacterium angustum]EAS65482.1 hypothetical protein VAS14_09234 [Photobacterium angustum S14]
MTITNVMSQFYLQRLNDTENNEEYDAIIKMFTLCNWVPRVQDEEE